MKTDRENLRRVLEGSTTTELTDIIMCNFHNCKSSMVTWLLKLDNERLTNALQNHGWDYVVVGQK